MAITRRPGSLNQTSAVTRLSIYGNSLPAGFGASSSDKDMMTRLAAMLKAREYNYARNGAVLNWGQDVVRAEFGVFATVLQTHQRPLRAATALTAISSIGGTTLTVTQTGFAGVATATGPAFKVGDIVMVGDGTNGECMYVSAVPSATSLTVTSALTASGLLLRAHAVGDPVYVVPTEYDPGNCMYIICEGHNMLSRYSPDVETRMVTWFKDTYRGCLSRLRCAEIYEPDHTALAFAGTWSAAIANAATCSGTTAQQGVRQVTVNGGTVTFHVPDNFEGGTVVLSFITTLTAAGQIDFTVDAVGAGSLVTTTCPTSPVSKPQMQVKRFTGLTAGRHKIVATVSNIGTGGTYFDWAGIEALVPPVVVMWKLHRLYGYDIFTSALAANGHIRPTLTAQANPTATAITVTQSPVAASRQIAAASIPAVGEKITINPGSALEESRIVTSVTGAGAPFTINFTGGLANTQPSGTVVHMGIKDSDLGTLNGWIDAIVAEFDDFVVPYNADPFLLKQPQYFFAGDGAHFSDAGHAVIARTLADQLVTEERLTTNLTSRGSQIQSPIPGNIDFLNCGDLPATGSTGKAYAAIPAAETEFPTAGNYRRQVDLSRAVEARLHVIQTANTTGVAAIKFRIMYSIDAGTTWRHLSKRFLSGATGTDTGCAWTEPIATETCMIEVTGFNVNGYKVSGWGNIYPQALTDVLLRVVTIGGTATGSNTFSLIALEFR